jgi:hypothetical protein
MLNDLDWTAPATLLIFVGKDRTKHEPAPGFVPIKQGTLTEVTAFYTQCSDWIMQHSRLVVPGVVQVDGYDIGDLRDRLYHAT